MHEFDEHVSDRFSVRVLAAPEHEDVAGLSVHGDIDLATAPMLRDALLPVLERQRGPVVIDLSEVAFMDSSGVHVLIDVLQRLGSQNRRLALVCPEHGQIRRLLALVGLLDALTVHASRDSAMNGDGQVGPHPLGHRSRRSVAQAPEPPTLADPPILADPPGAR